MSNVFLGEPSEEIKKWFVETYIAEDDYTILSFVDGSSKKLYINGATTYENIGVKKSQWSLNNTLKSCQLGKKVTEISSYTFYDCRSLTSITIPSSVTSIGTSAFYKCGSLTSIVFEGKTQSDITSMANYPWGINNNLSINNGTIFIPPAPSMPPAPPPISN